MRLDRLSHQILVVFVAVVILALGLSGWAITTLAQRIVTDNVAQGHQELARRIAEEINLEMEDIRPILSLLIESATVRTMDPASVLTELTRYQAHFPAITAAYVAGLDGQQIARTDGRPLENVATTFGFQVTWEGHELLSDVYLPEAGQGPMLTVYLPIVDDGETVGVLVADVNFARVQDILEGLALSRNETAVVFAPNGRAVAHSRMAELAEPPALTDLMLIETLVRGPAGVVEDYRDELGRTVVGVHAPVHELGWGVVIQTPVGELASEVATLRRTMTMGLLGGVALAVVAGWLMARRLANPIGQLAQATERVAAGDLATTVEISASNEVGVLAASFNKMVASLKESRDKIEQLYAEVKELNVDLEQRINLATEEIRQRAEELAALYEVGRSLAVTLDLGVLLPVIAKRVTTTLEADRCAVFLFDERAGVLRVRAAHGYMAERLSDFSYRPGEEIVGRAYATGETQHVPDLDLVPDLPRRDAIRAVLAVPLASPTAGPLGVLSVTSLRAQAFSSGHQQLLETMASQMAGAIEKARLFEETQQRVAELEALRRTSLQLSSSLDLAAVLDSIAENALSLVEATNCIIYFYDEASGALVFGTALWEDGRREAAVKSPRRNGLTATVAREGRAMVINDATQHPLYATPEARKWGLQAIAGFPLKRAGRVLGVFTIAFFEPHTLSEEELRVLGLLADQAAIAIENARLYQEAQEADRLKSAFLASMSHELRTPLNSIIGFTGIMLQGLAGPLNPEQEKQLNMVYDSARHLLALINDVLDISKIEAGQLEVTSEPFDMRQAIEKVVQTVTPLAEKKGLVLLSRVAPEVGQIVSDRRRVEQILINLLNNAVKFTEQGEVRIACQVDDGWLVTRVVDTGIGIKPEDMDKLFKPFRQIETGLTRRYEGTGLGLSICRRLVEMLGGEIWAESEWGVGSTFTFTLPVG